MGLFYDEKKIIKLNVVLLICLLVSIVSHALFEYPMYEDTYIEVIFSITDFQFIMMSLLLGVLFILLGAKLIQVVWNVVVIDLIDVKNLGFQQALSIILIIEFIRLGVS